MNDPRRTSALAAALPPGDALTASRAERFLALVHYSSAAGRHLRRQLAEVAAAAGLSDGELLVVWLCRGGGRVQVELAAAIGVSPAQMSGMVERLRSRGLVDMHRPSRDRRRQVWCTSQAGFALLDGLAPRLEALAAGIDVSMPPTDQHAMVALCSRVAEGIHAPRPQAEPHDPQHGSKEAA